MSPKIVNANLYSHIGKNIIEGIDISRNKSVTGSGNDH